MPPETIHQLFAAYAIRPVRLLPVQKGYRNESHPAVLADRQRLNLIIYKREPGICSRIARANSVADALAAQGFPARSTHDPRILRLTSGTITKYAALYDYLPGKTIPWEAYTMRHLKLLGKTMGDMHRQLQELPTANAPTVVDEYTAIVARMRTYFADSNVELAMAQKLAVIIDHRLFGTFANLLDGCAGLPCQHMLHMDFVRGNILFDTKANAPTITGVLDFEKTAVGHPLFDIARTYAFLLVDCTYKSPDQVRKYFLQSGYNRRSSSTFTITAKNAQLLEQLANLFLLYDFYKFLRHNPYESLHANHHFVRTKEQLRTRKIIC